MAINPSDAIPWIMLAGVGVACVSALFSWRSSKVAAKAAQATLYVKLHEQYASHEMLGDLRNLRSWKEDPANREDFAGRWAELRGKTDPNALEVGAQTMASLGRAQVR